MTSVPATGKAQAGLARMAVGWLPLSAEAPLVFVARVELLHAILEPETWLPDQDAMAIRRHVRPQDRAARFAAWGLARLLLGSLMGLPAASLAVTRSSRGRPALSTGGPDFNISHAGDWVAVGLSADGRIGVDVEQARPCGLWEAIASDFLSGPEHQMWLQLDPEARAVEALRRWCMKEAVLKAVGEGLAGDARSVHVGRHAEAGPLIRCGHAFHVQVQEICAGLCLASALTPPAEAQVHILGPADAGDLRALMETA